MKNLNITKHWIVLIISIIVSISLLFFSFSYSKKVLDKSNQEKIETEYNHLKNNMNIFENNRKAYISIIANHISVLNFLNNKNLENEKKVITTFIKQIENLDLIMQIRLLSNEGQELIKIEGQELIKIDTKDNKYKIIKKEKLQNKSKRDYFKDFIKLEKNEMGISKLDLNVEFEKIEKPFKPTLRLAMPVFEKNIKKGLLVINYEMKTWLNQYLKSPYLNIYLIDKDGYFIIHPNEKYNWSRFLDSKIDVKKEFNLDITNLKSLKSISVKEIDLWDKNKYYLVYDYKNTEDKQLFINQTKVISISIILAILILILPFFKIIFEYIKKVKDTENRINAIFNNSLDSIIMINQKGIIQTVNNIALKTFDYEEEELIGKNISMLVPEPHHSKHNEYIKNHDEKIMTKVLTKKRELFGITKNKKLIPITLVITKVYIEKELYFIGTIRNIKSEKQSNKLFQNVFKESPLGIALVLDDGKFWRLSEKFCSIVGYTNEELIKLTFQDITHPEDLEIDLGFVKKLINKELDRYSLEKRYIHKNGKTVWINLSVSPIFLDENKDKLEYFIAMIEDITEKKRVLEKLLEAEEISQLGHWDWDIKEDDLYWSETMLKIFGKEKNTSKTYEDFIEIVHPDDKELVNKKVQDSFENNIPFNMK